MPGTAPPADPLDRLLGASPAMATLRADVRRLLSRAQGAGLLPSVLILGETGTGKGFLASLLHQAGPRRDGPLVDINCASLPAPLLESELFGHERGAFTGAAVAKVGLFQAAHRGTLFLDEIALLDTTLQAKLLKAVEERQVRRVGSRRAEPVDVWIISATNEDLGRAVRAGRFREDLYHRLAVVTLSIPPLRSRGEDAVRLARHFLDRVTTEYRLAPLALGPEAETRIRAHGWPGNVRQLANAVERAALLAEGPRIGPEGLGLEAGPESPPGMDRSSPVVPSRPARESRDVPPAQELQAALDRHGGNVSRAAAALGIARNTLRAHIRRLDLRGGRPRSGAPAPSAGPPGPPGGPAGGASVAASPPEELGVREPAAPHETSRPGAWSTLRWERRLLTFWAAAFTPPEGVQALQLAPVLGLLATTVERFGGRVETVEPQRIVATFGAEPMEDGPRRAAAAALAGSRSLVRAGGPADTRWAIEVAEQLVTLGSPMTGLAPDERQAVWAALDRLLAAAAPGEIRVGDAAVPHLDRRFELRRAPAEAGPAVLVGGRPGLAARIPGAGPLVGREHQLAILHDLLARAEAGRGQVLGVVGDPGVGKSRLLDEFLSSLDPARSTRLLVRCPSHGTTIAFLPIIELVREAFQLGEEESLPAIKVRLQSGLEAAGLDAFAGVPYLLHLLGWAPDAAALGRAVPETLRARALDLLRGLVLAESRRRPLVCLIEDLQWADASSVEALGTLADGVGSGRILLVVTYRPGYSFPWLDRAYAHQLTVPRLTPTESHRMLEGLMPPGRQSDDLVRHLVAQAGGIPFYLEELARVAADQGGILPEIPATVQAALAARLDRLEPSLRDLIEAAAVLGEEFSAPHLATVLDRPLAGLAPDLARLQSVEFVVPSGGPGPAAFRFRHALTQEVAYRTLLEERRRALHGRVAEALAATAPDLRERRPEVVARHYTEAGQPFAAIPYWRRAGQLALRRSAHVEASAHLTEALRLLRTQPAGPARTPDEVSLLVELATALAARYGFAAPEVVPSLERAQALADQLGDQTALYPLRWALWRFSFSRADYRRGQTLASQLLEAADRRGDGFLRLGGHVATGIVDFYCGRLATAREHLARAAALDDPEASARQVETFGQDLGAVTLAFQAWRDTLAGDLSPAVAATSAALQRARRAGHPLSLATTLYLVAVVYQLWGDVPRLQALGAELRALADAHAYRLFTAFGLMVSGWAARAIGKLPEGLELIRDGAALFRQVGQRAGLFHRTLLAEALLAAGTVDDAREVLDGGLAHAEETGEAAFVAEIHRLRGHLMMRQGAGAEAVLALRRARSIASAHGAWLFALRAATDLVDLAGSAPPLADREVLAGLTIGRAAEPELPDLRRAQRLLGISP